MGFGQAVATCLGKYATFSGRASRSEFWWFYLFVLLVTWLVDLVAYETLSAEPILALTVSFVVSLFFLLPALAAACRRLHDTGRSGWWQLLYFTIVGIIVIIIWLIQKSRPENNRYGPP